MSSVVPSRLLPTLAATCLILLAYPHGMALQQSLPATSTAAIQGPLELKHEVVSDKWDALIEKITVVDPVAHQERWSDNIDGKLGEAVVLGDGGVVAAYYAKLNCDAESLNEFGMNEGDTLCIDIWNGEGVKVQHVAVGRKSRRISHGGYYPTVAGIVVVPWSEKVIVRTSEGLISSGGESWWVFETRFGGLHGVFLPRFLDGVVSPRPEDVLDVLAVPDVKLLAILWMGRSDPVWRGETVCGDLLSLCEFGDVPRIRCTLSGVDFWPEIAVPRHFGLKAVKDRAITLETLDGQSWVADIVYTGGNPTLKKRE